MSTLLVDSYILLFCFIFLCLLKLAAILKWYFTSCTGLCNSIKCLQRAVPKQENISHSIHAGLLDNIWYQHMTEISMQTANTSYFVCSLIPHATDSDRLHSSKEVPPNITMCLLHLFLCRIRAQMQPLCYTGNILS